MTEQMEDLMIDQTKVTSFVASKTSTTKTEKDNKSTSTPFQYSKRTKDILIDFAIVYAFVPLWITLFASMLKYSREQYIWTQSCISDLVLLTMIIVLVGLPLNYLRLQAIKPSHFLHKFRIETSEVFMEETLSQPAPSPFAADVMMLSMGTIWYSLSDLFDERLLSEVSLFTLYSQSMMMFAVNDAWTYWIHRMFHHPMSYKYHKMHHEVRNTIAFRAFHFDAVDTIMSAISLHLTIPVIFQVCGTPMVHEVWIISVAFIEAQAFVIHSDLYLISARWSLGLFWGDAAICHSNHHFKNAGNFGSVSPLIWDWLCNTRYQPRTRAQQSNRGKILNEDDREDEDMDQGHRYESFPLPNLTPSPSSESSYGAYDGEDEFAYSAEEQEHVGLQ